MKTLYNTSVEQVKSQVPDVKVTGNGDLWLLLCKASSKSERWMKSTKAMYIKDVGCVVQVTTQQGEAVSEAVTFVPGVCIVDDVNGGRKLARFNWV